MAQALDVDEEADAGLDFDAHQQTSVSSLRSRRRRPPASLHVRGHRRADTLRSSTERMRRSARSMPTPEFA
jgi:hypothetical protein